MVTDLAALMAIVGIGIFVLISFSLIFKYFDNKFDKKLEIILKNSKDLIEEVKNERIKEKD